MRLHPADDFHAPLQCSIAFASLDDADPDDGVDYTALSYSWDAQTPSRLIECDGGKLLITRNCASAMRQLRGREADETLWIDSICIDQSAEAVNERNGQVALMADIYKLARNVVIWLGEGSPKMDLALEAVRHVTATEPANETNRREIQAILR